MEMASATDLMKKASAGSSGSGPADDVQLELLHRGIERPFISRVPLVVPLLVIAITAIAVPQRTLLWSLVAAFTIISVLGAAAASRVRSAIEAKRPAQNAVKLWLTIEFFGSAIWGLMLAPISDASLVGPERAIITAVIMVTISTTCLIASNALGMPKALIAGFLATALPIFTIQYAENGAIMLVSAFLMFLGLTQLVSKAQRETLQSMENARENQQLTKSLATALDRAQYLSRHDSLTGLLNRRDFEATASQLRAVHSGSSIAIVMIDLDHFKSVNDRFGHATGDDVLKTAATIITSSVRAQNIAVGEDDAVARWGGEEFVLALANTDINDAAIVAERIRNALAEYTNTDWPEGLVLTGSIGVTLWGKAERLSEAIDRADRAMFNAKADGRDQVKIAEQHKQKRAPNETATDS